MSYRPYADIVSDSVAAVASVSKVEKFVLSGTDISNKYVTLSASPATPSDTLLMVKSAPSQYYGDDFTVIGSQLSWSSLGLDGILASGDELTVVYRS